MAQKDYPGLVIVPPSDRTILRRRLLRWSLFLIPTLWIAWTVIGSPPASQDDSACQDATSQDTPGSPTEECGQSHPEAATIESREEDFRPPPVSQPEHLAESQQLIPSPPPENHLPSPEPTTHEDQPPKPSVTAPHPADGTEPGSNNEKTPARAPAKKSPSNPNPDAQLAEHGDAFAQYRLGKYYAKEKGPHAPESISWYKKASTGLRRLAEAGNGQAMYVLGVMYAYGRGVTRNTEEAHHWLSQAVRHNVTAARPVLAGLEAKRTGDHKAKERGPTPTSPR
ncbi:MAG: SEL1-like repeat protein [Nitrospira sp.]|nr:SEL1-like repeat protein [Nitrospira sp.]